MKPTNKRGSGILLHISSLPSNYNIGSFGNNAYEFIDFLKETNQSYWQILPIGPTSYGNSPYQTHSVNAINPYFIDLELLVNDNLLNEEQLNNINNFEYVDYDELFLNRINLLKLAFKNFNLNNNDFKKFIQKNNYWLEDYSLFITLKKYYNNKSLSDWPNEAKLRDKDFIEYFKNENTNDINFEYFIQYIAYKQYFNLKKYANDLDIKIIGDIPIYISYDSSDLWVNPKLFLLDNNLNMTHVAGVPSDSFSKEGQLWGNPLYNWNNHLKDNYNWWIKRIEKQSELFDILRIDHFIGFENYFAIEGDAKDAKNGQWHKGPSIDFFNNLKRKLPNINIIAEDLGVLTKDVRKLLKDVNYPGMKVLQFAFNNDFNNEYLPHTYNENTISYTGTHDNDTTKEWFNSLDLKTQKDVKDYLNCKDEEVVYSMIKEVLKSRSNIAIIPMQDYLELDGKARMNKPATTTNNWVYKLDKSLLNNELKSKIKRLTEISGRNIILDN